MTCLTSSSNTLPRDDMSCPKSTQFLIQLQFKLLTLVRAIRYCLSVLLTLRSCRLAHCYTTRRPSWDYTVSLWLLWLYNDLGCRRRLMGRRATMMHSPRGTSLAYIGIWVESSSLAMSFGGTHWSACLPAVRVPWQGLVGKSCRQFLVDRTCKLTIRYLA